MASIPSDFASGFLALSSVMISCKQQQQTTNKQQQTSDLEGTTSMHAKHSVVPQATLFSRKCVTHEILTAQTIDLIVQPEQY
jgi:hypothetical protein